MKTIPLTRGFVALVDDADFEFLTRQKWHAIRVKEKWYAQGSRVVRGRATTILMHRLIMGSPLGLEIDHRDNDGLNNQRGNLRICTSSDNKKNLFKTRNRFGYKGVRFCSGHLRTKPFQARIGTRQNRCSLGFFETAKEAAEAYNRKAVELYGEFAKLNQI